MRPRYEQEIIELLEKMEVFLPAANDKSLPAPAADNKRGKTTTLKTNQPGNLTATLNPTRPNSVLTENTIPAPPTATVKEVRGWQKLTGLRPWQRVDWQFVSQLLCCLFLAILVWFSLYHF